ncbi:MAG TPA: type II toxin-antitoxin system VapC family toxin [Spirochaetia bacterium]|nr:type II toxin-antitoxin system VapC family toxin [Spirochaetales bacterium]HRS66132.1 type II toxin-antitoxin system VapC family toxin [Spirochaetia bacterium]HRV27603.1 type II toxin-antitoxin system VapC family toxin [Spirochaetia bacterium]
MIVVLDASAGIEIGLGRDDLQKYEDLLEQASRVITSDLYKAEVANVLWKYVRAKLLTKDVALQRLQYCLNLIDEYIDITENNQESFIESIRIDYSVYDVLYLTIARRNGAILITQDKMLKDIAKELGIETI